MTEQQDTQKVIENYDDAIANEVVIFNSIVQENICYKPFTHEGNLYVPTIFYDHSSDPGINKVEMKVLYVKISRDLIDELRGTQK